MLLRLTHYKIHRNLNFKKVEKEQQIQFEALTFCFCTQIVILHTPEDVHTFFGDHCNNRQ